MLADYHVHTAFSDDSDYEMEAVVKDAIALGLDELCFTDHTDYGVKRDWDSPAGLPGQAWNVNDAAYAQEITRLRGLYGDRIAIKMGMEFGMQVHTVPRFQGLFEKYPFDFILLSVHQVEDQELWQQDYQRTRSQKQYNEGYYQELLSLVQRYKDYSVLAHLDCIVRYDLAGAYPFELLRPVITEILKEVIADGKGIEVNTSYHAYGLSDMTPSRDILRLYRSLGGRIVTIGSDSHTPEQLGAYIAHDKRELEALGFTEYCTYSAMEPIFHSIND